jgi:hypothetical protein
VAVKINTYKYKPYRISLKRTHHPLSMYEEIRERCVDLGVDPAVCDALITILSSPTSTMVELMRLIAETPMFPTDLATEMAVVFAYRPGMWFPPSLKTNSSHHPCSSGDQGGTGSRGGGPRRSSTIVKDWYVRLMYVAFHIVPPPPPPHSTLALREEEEESSPSLPPPVGEEHELSK